MQYTLAANFASGVGPCMGMVEPFKHLLRVTAHPHFLALELRALARDNTVYLLGMGVTKFHLFTNRNFVTLVRDNSEKHKMQETELLWLFQVHIN